MHDDIVKNKYNKKTFLNSFGDKVGDKMKSRLVKYKRGSKFLRSKSW